MVVIKVGKYRLKIINILILILLLVTMIYIIGNIFFMLPFFRETYNYKIKKDNYEIKASTTFKDSWLKCKVKETYILSLTDDALKEITHNDLIKDGFKKRNNRYIRVIKKAGICKNIKKEYKEEHKKDYVTFKLNGKNNVEVNYGNSYNDSYVTAKINGKSTNNITINSNLNDKKVGKYIVSYTLNISKYYKERLYRIVNIIDKEKPLITLRGSDVVNLNYGDKYIEEGFTAIDNYDGDITSKVEVKNTVDSLKAGTYKISYKILDSSGNIDKKQRVVIVKEKDTKVNKESPNIEVKDGITYVNGILLVNKNYSLPKNYDPKVNKEALKALEGMQADAKVLGLDLSLISGYRSYETQNKLYNKYVLKDGEKIANTYSAKPGHSEHQTGLAFDVGSVDRSFENTSEAKWLDENCHLYGFIIRYPKGKTGITGYIYEPWHIRYLGKENAKKVKESGLTLEEYLKIP